MSAETKRWQELKEKEKILKEAADSIKVQEKDLPNAVKRLFEEWKEKRKMVKKAN